MKCPNCQCKDVGKIGSSQFYCWNCFVEFAAQDTQVEHVFQVEEDGTLSSLDDLYADNMMQHHILSPSVALQLPKDLS